MLYPVGSLHILQERLLTISGLRPLDARGCSQNSETIHHDSCVSPVQTTSIIDETSTSITTTSPHVTPAPTLVAQVYRRDVDDHTAVCNEYECSIWDVSSSLLTIVTLPDVNSTSRPPFANNTVPWMSHGNFTMSSTKHPSPLTTGRSTNGSDNTTIVTSRVTVSVLTIMSEGWHQWTPLPTGAGTGTGARPANSANATNYHSPSMPPHWSVWSAPSKAPLHPSPPVFNSSVTASNTANVSYATTKTYVFSGSTVIIPIPAGYESYITSHTITPMAASTDASLVVGGVDRSTLSTSTCWTTDGKPTTRSGTTLAGSSKICWLLSCDYYHRCTDHVSRYPITVDAESTSSALYTNGTIAATATESSSGNHTAMPTTRPHPGVNDTTSAVPSGTLSHSTDHISPTATGGPEVSPMWMPWPPQQNNTGTIQPVSSHSEIDSISTHSSDTTSSSAMPESQTTYGPWLSSTFTSDSGSNQSPAPGPMSEIISSSIESTVTRVVVPIPAETSGNNFQSNGPIANRKRYLQERALAKAGGKAVGQSDDRSGT